MLCTHNAVDKRHGGGEDSRKTPGVAPRIGCCVLRHGFDGLWREDLHFNAAVAAVGIVDVEVVDLAKGRLERGRGQVAIVDAVAADECGRADGSAEPLEGYVDQFVVRNHADVYQGWV